jgi:putative FmdB family regulatory protein
MPIYNYHCNKCDEEFENFSSIDERKFSECPECGSQSELVFSPNINVAIHVFQPYLDTNISEKPVYIETKSQKQALLKQNGLTEM